MSALHRNADPQTSVDAAQSMRRRLPKVEGLVLDALHARPDGMTSEELSDTLGIERVTISPRLKPLERLGLVVRTDERRAGKSGRNGQVWRIA